jgi:adenylate kinase
MSRGNRRRVCHDCESDPKREPRRPAASSADDPERCAMCGSRLVTRPDDSPEILARRIERSREYLAQILSHADAARIPIHRLDGKQLPTATARMALRILSQHYDFGSPGLPTSGAKPTQGWRRRRP